MELVYLDIVDARRLFGVLHLGYYDVTKITNCQCVAHLQLPGRNPPRSRRVAWADEPFCPDQMIRSHPQWRFDAVRPWLYIGDVHNRLIVMHEGLRHLPVGVFVLLPATTVQHVIIFRLRHYPIPNSNLLNRLQTLLDVHQRSRREAIAHFLDPFSRDDAPAILHCLRHQQTSPAPGGAVYVFWAPANSAQDTGTRTRDTVEGAFVAGLCIGR